LLAERSRKNGFKNREKKGPLKAKKKKKKKLAGKGNPS
jgi:hypothetical protein